jgi:hypothetical protein
VAAEADAAAHREALEEGHDGLGVFVDPRVHPVFVAPEVARHGVVARDPGPVDLGDVAARAEGAVALGIDQDEGDGRVLRPCDQRRVDGAAHGGVSAFSARGRFSVIRPARPSMRIRTSLMRARPSGGPRSTA